MKETECPNCGAVFAAQEASCPYCGAFNPAGAEAKFLRDLEKTRRDLDNVDEEARASYAGEIKKGAGSAARIVAIVLAAILVLAGGFLLLEKTVFSSDKRNYAEELAWEHRRFAEYDALFDAEEYEALMAAIASDGEAHDVWNWERYEEFMEITGDLEGSS